MLLTLARRRCALADPKQRGRDGRAAVSLVLGLKLRALRVGATLLSPPFLSIPPLKDALKAGRSSTGGPEHDVQQSEQEISRDWRD